MAFAPPWPAGVAAPCSAFHSTRAHADMKRLLLADFKVHVRLTSSIQIAAGKSLWTQRRNCVGMKEINLRNNSGSQEVSCRGVVARGRHQVVSQWKMNNHGQYFVCLCSLREKDDYGEISCEWLEKKKTLLGAKLSFYPFGWKAPSWSQTRLLVSLILSLIQFHTEPPPRTLGVWSGWI